MGSWEEDECYEFRRELDELFERVYRDVKAGRYDFLRNAIDIDVVKSIYVDRPHEIIVIPDMGKLNRRAEVLIYVDPMSLAVTGTKGECKYNRVADHNRVSFYNSLLEYLDYLSQRPELQVKGVGQRTRSVMSIALDRVN